eukprot:6214636-Pleurochrysis_carterae.AAC.3
MEPSSARMRGKRHHLQSMRHATVWRLAFDRSGAVRATQSRSGISVHQACGRGRKGKFKCAGMERNLNPAASRMQSGRTYAS